MILQHSHQVVDCPICGRPLEMEIQLASHEIACGYCRGEFTVYETEDGITTDANREGADLLERAEELLRALGDIEAPAAEHRCHRISSDAMSDHKSRADDSRLFPLARHHCIKSSHRCCRPETFQDKQELARAGSDLKAATVHFNRGSLWAGSELDEETRNLIAGAQLTADQLIQQDTGSQSDVQHTIHALHGKLEKISGLKIMLAQPLPPEEDKSGPSIFR